MTRSDDTFSSAIEVSVCGFFACLYHAVISNPQITSKPVSLTESAHGTIFFSMGQSEKLFLEEATLIIATKMDQCYELRVLSVFCCTFDQLDLCKLYRIPERYLKSRINPEVVKKTQGLDLIVSAHPSLKTSGGKTTELSYNTPQCLDVTSSVKKFSRNHTSYQLHPVPRVGGVRHTFYELIIDVKLRTWFHKVHSAHIYFFHNNLTLNLTSFQKL